MSLVVEEESSGRQERGVVNVIQLTDVSYVRDASLIIDHVNWDVKRGEHWVVIGPNGSGKSTLLNMITGYIWPSSGSVEVLGHRYGRCEIKEVRKSIGWVSLSIADKFRESRPFDSALDVVLSGLFASVGVYDSVTQEQVDQASKALEQFGCLSLKSHLFSTLSQGEQQRVILARAWISNPELLILDEPCTGLDVAARESLLDAINSLGSFPDGPTMLYVTHHAEEIVPIFTHVLLVREGRAIAMGSKHEIVSGSHLSKAFELDLEVLWHSDRPWVVIGQKTK